MVAFLAVKDSNEWQSRGQEPSRVQKIEQGMKKSKGIRNPDGEERAEEIKKI